MSEDKNKKDKKKEDKKNEDIEAESSEEEDEEVKVTRVGYIEKKTKKNWKAYSCLLIGGSFYYYKKPGDAEAKGNVDLQDMAIETPAKGEKKEYSFSILKGEEIVFVGACSSEPEFDQWTKELKEACKKSPTPAPSQSGTKSKKAGLAERAKRKAASNAATSALGKKVMKAIVNEETTTLLNALKKIVKHESNSAKKAEDLEKNIIKIAVKAYLLIEKKALTADDFLVADKPLRDAFELMVKVFNGRGRVKDEKISEALKKVEQHLKKAEEVITNLLAPHLTAKNMIRISAAFGCLANEKFLNTVFREPELEMDLDKLVDAMDYYTQFHYH
eukprot:TRINITY_DN2030_c0_g1_i1.p2 TRINITY_DN2030_c0_g1~~TRINITY_DN2030_c0_g1_i1.p2  ORF type:complete len:346 (-),score=105.66 TRINITY_DN2030_c0_g1_i1:2005-2997(-)